MVHHFALQELAEFFGCLPWFARGFLGGNTNYSAYSLGSHLIVLKFVVVLIANHLRHRA